MNTAAVIIGNHAFFFREGDAFTDPAPGTCGRESKPGAADAGWIDFGSIVDLSLEHSMEERQIFKATPGQLRLHDAIDTKRVLSVDFTAQEMSPIVFEILFGTLALDGDSDQYNPLAGGTKKGWLKLQQYDQSDALFNTVDLFCKVSVSGPVDFADDIVKPKFNVKVFQSTLNTGAIIPNP